MTNADPSHLDMITLIGALGTDSFEAKVLHFLSSIAGVEHYSIYRVRGQTPEFLGGASISGEHPARLTGANQRYQRTYAELLRALDETQAEARLVHDPIDSADDPGLAGALQHYHIVDRVMLCACADEDFYAVTLMRSRTAGHFSSNEIAVLEETANLIIAVCAKHASIHWDRPRGVKIFQSVEVIEATLRAAKWGISVRELQVSARILFGISALGIGIDLGLGEDTVATYRKRLYARLSIGSRHELMQKYLALF
jgi:DNA-binding CsgD family transcriptional regulator